MYMKKGLIHRGGYVAYTIYAGYWKSYASSLLNYASGTNFLLEVYEDGTYPNLQYVESADEEPTARENI